MIFSEIGLIGCGNIGSAFVRGWLKAGPSMAARITVADALPAAAQRLSAETGVATATDNGELIERSDLVMLAVKPGDIEPALEGCVPLFGKGKVLVSVAAGRTIAFLEALFPVEVPVIRIMPNMAVEVGAGTICFAAGNYVDPEVEQEVAELLGGLGRVVPLEEKLFAAATAISGSGPGFMALIADAFIDAGVMSGLPGGISRELTNSMIAGTAGLLNEAGLSAGELRRKVTSPAGTTAAGITELERGGVRSAIIDSVQAAVNRAHELG